MPLLGLSRGTTVLLHIALTTGSIEYYHGEIGLLFLCSRGTGKYALNVCFGLVLKQFCFVALTPNEDQMKL